MAQQIRFITSEDYDRSARDIRGEFERQTALIEAGNKQLRDDFDNKLATVNGTLSGKLGELNTELGIVKKDLHSLKDEVQEHGVLLAQHGILLADLANRLERIEGVRMNATMSRLYEKITPIGRFISGIGLELPSDFPSTARDFWNLKYKPTEKNSKH